MKSTTAIFALAGAVILAACSPAPKATLSMEEAAEYYQEAASAINAANQANSDRWEEAFATEDLTEITELCGEAAALVRSFTETLDARFWPREIEVQVNEVVVETEQEAASYEACEAAADAEEIVAALDSLPEHDAAQELRGLLGLDAD